MGALLIAVKSEGKTTNPFHHRVSFCKFWDFHLNGIDFKKTHILYHSNIKEKLTKKIKNVNKKFAAKVFFSTMFAFGPETALSLTMDTWLNHHRNSKNNNKITEYNYKEVGDT